MRSRCRVQTTTNDQRIHGLGEGRVVQNPFKMGYDGVNVAGTMIRERTEVQSTDTGVTVLTQENLTDPEVQAVLNPTCEEPPV